MALSFSSAAKQFEERRALIVEEANATGTVRLSISLAPQDLRPGLNLAMDRYQASRRASHEVAGDESAFRKRFAATQALQRELWSHAVEAASRPDASPGVNMLLLPALNRLFDLATVRAMALTTHMPDMVFIVIGIGVIIASVLTGYSQGTGKGRSWLHVVAFTSLMALVCYTIMDLEYPRLGIIRIEAFEAKLPS
ncbi:bestrophin-like domain [Sphingopyxis fribergensis]|nr:DUF4239 domain-containing protein [Sphingopyxis fribergensis]